MKTKKFLAQFVVTGEMAELDLEEICYDAIESKTALRGLVEKTFKLGVADGLFSAECAVARALNVKVDEMEESENPALQAVMKMSIRCYRAAKEEEGENSNRTVAPRRIPIRNLSRHNARANIESK